MTPYPWMAWHVGPTGARITMATFGASAPLQELQQRFGLTAEHVVSAAYAQVGRQAPEPVHAA